MQANLRAPAHQTAPGIPVPAPRIARTVTIKVAVHLRPARQDNTGMGARASHLRTEIRQAHNRDVPLPEEHGIAPPITAVCRAPHHAVRGNTGMGARA